MTPEMRNFVGGGSVLLLYSMFFLHYYYYHYIIIIIVIIIIIIIIIIIVIIIIIIIIIIVIIIIIIIIISIIVIIIIIIIIILSLLYSLYILTFPIVVIFFHGCVLCGWLYHHMLSVSYISRESWVLCLLLLCSLMMFANDWVQCDSMVVFFCLQITLPHYHYHADLPEGIELLICLSGIFCIECVSKV